MIEMTIFFLVGLEANNAKDGSAVVISHEIMNSN